MEVLLGYHRFLVEAWLGVMIANLLFPYLLRSDPSRRIFYTRVGYFAFWALWAMVGFSGLMVWLFAGRPMNGPVIAMIAAAVILPLLDGYRAIRLKRLWLAEQEGLGFSATVILLEIAILLGITLWEIFS